MWCVWLERVNIPNETPEKRLLGTAEFLKWFKLLIIFAKTLTTFRKKVGGGLERRVLFGAIGLLQTVSKT